MSAPRLLHVTLFLFALSVVAFAGAQAEVIQIDGSSGRTGIEVQSQDASGVRLHFEMSSFNLDDVVVDGQTLSKVALPGVFLPNDAGAPDLPGIGRFVAIPEGADARVEILSSERRVYQGIEVGPAPVIPRETEDGPLVYARNQEIYQADALYPIDPVQLSRVGEMRGVDCVTIGVTPFQYNPVTKELIAYTDLEIRIEFIGGTGQFGEERLRSRFWEPILANQLLNYETLSPVDFDQPRLDRNGFEYLIITPDDPAFLAWADTIKAWRTLQGISTEVFSTTDIGGETSTVIEGWLNNAYANWDPAPAAFLILGDYPGTGLRQTGITSPIWNSYCVSDNIYADVNGDNLPDMVHARITARDEAELEGMIGKFLSYERNPPTNPDFYDHPIIAGGWQTERWFILCAEVCYGHQEVALGKHPVREYAIYSGSPGTSWSSNPNTYLVVDYFGPNGLGYIPSTPQHLTDWGGNATRINNDINSGAYMMLHRDHGYELGWGEPNYSTSNLPGLTNDDLIFVFSMNCLTGKYNYSSESFTEMFHRMEHGALGLIAASEISYSFVNDCLVWGLFDGMWPGFMPDYGPYPPDTGWPTDLRPAFGMANGKYFLQASSWPYNPGDKTVTHHLFHHHSDAFLQIYSEVPAEMNVSHDDVCFLGVPTYQVQTEFGAFIALTVDGEIIGTATGTGFPQDISIVPQSVPGTLHVTVTKPNRYRYHTTVPIVPAEGPYLIYAGSTVMDGFTDDDATLDAGETVDLDIVLHNVGVDPTTNVSASITSDDPYVEILVAEQSFPDIPSDSLRHCMTPYEIHVAGDAPEGHVANFLLHSQATEGNWESAFSLEVQAPVLVGGAILVDDSAPHGNGDGCADPGETIYLQLLADNIGSADASDLAASLSSFDPYVIIQDADGSAVRIVAGEEGLFSAFEVEILALCPSPHMVPIHLSITGPDEFTAELDYEIAIGPWADDVETDRGWSLFASDDNASTGQWVRVDPNGTTYNGFQCQPEDDHTTDPGVACFVTGNGSVGGAAGEADVDGGKTTLLTPVFDLSNALSASVSYWRWYTNDLGNNPGEDWWDVEATSDGELWFPLEHTQASDASWTYHEFILSDILPMTDHIQLRFVASDVGAGGSLVEAAVDDFTLTAVRTPVTDATAAGSFLRDAIVSCSPNPFNPQMAITYRTMAAARVDLRIFDVAGRLVRTLVDGRVDSGEHSVVFDGNDQRGNPVSSGIYFLRLDTPQTSEVRQIALLK